jgi:LEA14-like dessication related protein
MNALDIQNPRYSFRDIRPRVNVALPLSASTIDFDFNLGIDNPNNVGLRLDRVDFDVFVNSQQIVNTSSQQGVRIPARGYGEAHLLARVGYENIRSIFNQIADVIQGNRANYELRGNAWYDTPAGPLQFPLTVYSSR